MWACVTHDFVVCVCSRLASILSLLTRAASCDAVRRKHLNLTRAATSGGIRFGGKFQFKNDLQRRRAAPLHLELVRCKLDLKLQVNEFKDTRQTERSCQSLFPAFVSITFSHLARIQIPFCAQRSARNEFSLQLTAKSILS